MSYTQVFGGTTIYPSDVSYLALALSADKALEWPLESNDPSNPAARIIDVTTGGSYSVTLPDATQTGAGQTILFNNLPASTNSFLVKDYSGSTLATVGVGEQWQVYLSDTSTAAGTWRVFRYGASTATVQASALAGYGLTVTSNTLSQSLPVTTFNTSPRTLLATDRASALVWTGTGTGTLNLIGAATVGNNFFIAVRNSGGGDLTVDAAGSETIDGAGTLALRPGESTNLMTDGLTWYTLGLGQEAVFAFDYTSISVTGGTYTLAGSELNRIAYKFVGALTSDQYIVVPSTIQQYWVDNGTTGVYNFYLQTSGGTPVSVPQGGRGIYYCNGTNVVDADTATISLPVSATDGGTGQTSYTTGDLLYASSATTLAKLPDVAVGNVLRSGGVGLAPAWGKVVLTTDVNGTLSAANGGTGQSTYTTGDLLYASGATALAKLADVATGNALLSGGVGVAPAWGKIGLTTHVSGTLPVANGGTGVTTSTGSGSVVLSTSPTLVTPTLGVASATSIATGLGAAATPSHTFTGDLNTGFWSPGADILAASTGGSERFRVTLAGNVGIGTTAPDANGKVDILGNIDPGTTPAALSVRNTGVAAGTATPQYGIRVSVLSYNNATANYGVYAFAYQNVGNTTYGIWGDAGSPTQVGGSNQPFYGATGRAYANSAAAHNLTNGNLPVGVYGTVVSTGSTNTSITAAGYFTNTSTFGSESYGIYVNVATGPTTTIAARFDFAGTEVARIDSAGGILSRGTGGIGYRTGAGGTVTQVTSRTTGVTINKTTGSITLVSAAGTTTWQSFTVTNSTVAATDVIKVVQRSGTDLYMIHVTNVAAGSFQITFATTGGTTTEQPVFNFAVIKGATT